MHPKCHTCHKMGGRKLWRQDCFNLVSRRGNLRLEFTEEVLKTLIEIQTNEKFSEPTVGCPALYPSKGNASVISQMSELIIQALKDGDIPLAPKK